MLGFIGNHLHIVFGAMVVLFAAVMIGVSVEDALGRR